MISVVIPTHDRLALLSEAVQSVLVQTTSDWELIVIDDHSIDGTAEWVKSTSDERVRVVQLEEHSERSRARNIGLSRAQGDHVLFLDDDDLLLPRALEYLLTGFQPRGVVASV